MLTNDVVSFEQLGPAWKELTSWLFACVVLLNMCRFQCLVSGAGCGIQLYVSVPDHYLFAY